MYVLPQKSYHVGVFHNAVTKMSAPLSVFFADYVWGEEGTTTTRTISTAQKIDSKENLVGKGLPCFYQDICKYDSDIANYDDQVNDNDDDDNGDDDDDDNYAERNFSIYLLV